MTITPWPRPVQTLVASTPSNITGPWSLLQTVAVAVCQLSWLPALDDDLSLTHAAMDLREGAGELQWAHPCLPTTGIVIDVVAASVDDVHGCRTAITALIRAALHTTARLLDQPALSSPDLLTLGRVVTLLSHAHLPFESTPPACLARQPAAGLRRARGGTR
jgi:hypothetical protein